MKFVSKLFLATVLTLLLAIHVAESAPLIFGEAKPAPEMDSLFQQTDNWIGGDGVCSVALTPERTLWLFSDTWVGSVRDGKRVNATIVNNTLALQDGRVPGAKLQFIVRHDVDGKPTAFLTPADHRGWFWMLSGVYVQKHLYMVLMQMDKTGANNVFGFRQIGQWLGVVSNPLDPPTAWQVEQYPLPCVQFSPERQMTFGSAVLEQGGYLYLYGNDEDKKASGLQRYLTVARVPTNEVTNFAAWRFYAKGEWDADFHHASRIAGNLATDCSVSFLSKSGQYVLIYTDRGLSPNIEARIAPAPWGIWSPPTTVYQCPEMGQDKNLFCYGAKAHPSLGNEDQLLINYVVNSFNFWQPVTNADLYWPRFIRVGLETGKK